MQDWMRYTDSIWMNFERLLAVGSLYLLLRGFQLETEQLIRVCSKFFIVGHRKGGTKSVEYVSIVLLPMTSMKPTTKELLSFYSSFGLHGPYQQARKNLAENRHFDEQAALIADKFLDECNKWWDEWHAQIHKFRDLKLPGGLDDNTYSPVHLKALRCLVIALEFEAVSDNYQTDSTMD